MTNVVSLRGTEQTAPENEMRKVPFRPKNTDVRRVLTS